MQTTVLLRTLAYDRALKGSVGAAIDIAILSRSDLPASVKEASDVKLAFKMLETAKVTVAGIPLVVTELTYTKPDALPDLLKEGLDLVYITDDLDADLAKILPLCADRKIRTLAGERAFLEKGAMLGFFAVDSKPKLVVNVDAAKAQGADFSADLFKVAEVIRAPEVVKASP